MPSSNTLSLRKHITITFATSEEKRAPSTTFKKVVEVIGGGLERQKVSPMFGSYDSLIIPLIILQRL